MTKRMPCQTCLMCDKSIDETGGVRLIWSGAFGVTLRTIKDALGDIHHPCRTIRLEDNHRDVVVVLFGDWSNEAIERARQVAQKGWRPWFCQRCDGKRICQKCGHPMRPAAADVLDDAGKIRYAFVVSGMASCRNRDCDDFVA